MSSGRTRENWHGAFGYTGYQKYIKAVTRPMGRSKVRNTRSIQENAKVSLPLGKRSGQFSMGLAGSQPGVGDRKFSD